MKRKIRNGSKGKSDNTEDSWTSVKHDNKFSSLRTHNSYGTPKAILFSYLSKFQPCTRTFRINILNYCSFNCIYQPFHKIKIEIIKTY